MEELLKKQQFQEIEKILLEMLRNNSNNIDILMKLAMVRLQFPFEDEDTAISYLNEILKIEEFHFQALVIKMYLQHFYYHDMDKDLEKIVNMDWKDSYRASIADYIFSWRCQDFYDEKMIEKEIHWLKESINICSDLVNPYIELARIYGDKKQFDNAKECYRRALRNVQGTEFSFNDAISAQAFIDEYITGVRLSSINYKLLKEKIMLM